MKGNNEGHRSTIFRREDATDTLCRGPVSVGQPVGRVPPAATLMLTLTGKCRDIGIPRTTDHLDLNEKGRLMDTRASHPGGHVRQGDRYADGYRGKRSCNAKWVRPLKTGNEPIKDLEETFVSHGSSVRARGVSRRRSRKNVSPFTSHQSRARRNGYGSRDTLAKFVPVVLSNVTPASSLTDPQE